MKKDRNCGANMYPTYPTAMPQMVVPGVAPGMMNQMMPQQIMPNQMMMPSQYSGQMMMPNNQYSTQMMPNQSQTYTSGSLEQQVNNMANQVNNLERRVSSLEGLVGGNTNYNTSNFQMM